jgi:RNA polymerase sigma-70 factor (ECF subfamily)
MTLIAPNPPSMDADPAIQLGPRPTPSSSDQEIRDALLMEDQEALAEAYRRHGRKTYQVAYGVLRRPDLAEDVTQDVFVRLWQQPERFDSGRGTLGTFLKLDAHGRAVDLLRSEVSRAERELRDQQRSATSTVPFGLEEEVMRRITSEHVRDALALLAPDERAAIALAFFEGLSYRRVADALDLPEGTVKSRIRRGLMRLKELLGEEAPALG